MFSKDDLLSMSDYFCVLSNNGTVQYEVMSKNTAHCWNIVNSGSYYKLFHKHTLKESYHLHGEFDELFDCVLEIIDHDEWILNIWRYKHVGKKKQSRTFFDELVERYGVVKY